MQDVLDPTKPITYAVLVSYPKEKSIKKLLFGVYPKTSRAQISKKNKTPMFVNVAVTFNKINQVIFTGSQPRILKSLASSGSKIMHPFWQGNLTIPKQAR